MFALDYSEVSWRKQKQEWQGMKDGRYMDMWVHVLLLFYKSVVEFRG